MLHRALIVVLAIAMVLLQARLWLAGDGLRGAAQLREQLVQQRAENRRMAERNRRLEAEVEDLRKGFAALEERARSDIGLIGANETFYVFTEAPALAAREHGQ